MTSPDDHKHPESTIIHATAGAINHSALWPNALMTTQPRARMKTQG